MPNAGPTITKSQVGLVEAYTESSFANDESANLASFTPIPLQEGSAQLTLTEETHNPMQLLQNQLDYQEEVIGKRSCTLQMTIPLAPTGTAAGDGTTAIQGALGLLLSTCMGGEQLDAGTTVSTAWPTAGGGNVATSSAITKGGICGWVNGSSEVEARRAIADTGQTVQVRPAFSTTPATSDVIYGGANYYFTQDPDGSLNFAVRSLESDAAWLLMGCQLDSVSLSLPLDGTIPTAQMTWKGVNWLKEGSTTAGSFGDISAATYTGFDPITGQAGDFIYAAPTGLTATTVHVSSVGFEPAISYAAITSPKGTNGVHRWRMTRASGTPMVQGTFATFFEDHTWWTAKANKTAYQFLYQIGTTAGETVVIHASTAQVTDVQSSDSDQSIEGLTVTYKGRLDAGVSGASTDLEQTPLRIAFL